LSINYIAFDSLRWIIATLLLKEMWICITTENQQN